MWEISLVCHTPLLWGYKVMFPSNDPREEGHRKTRRKEGNWWRFWMRQEGFLRRLQNQDLWRGRLSKKKWRVLVRITSDSRREVRFNWYKTLCSTFSVGKWRATAEFHIHYENRLEQQAFCSVCPFLRKHKELRWYVTPGATRTIWTWLFTFPYEHA